MRKGQVNQVFIYLLSVILVVFAAFLVGKFLFAFSGDVESRSDTKLYDTLKQDFNTVYRTYGSEKVYSYRVSSTVSAVCFVESKSCIDNIELPLEFDFFKESLKIVTESGDNIAQFDKNGLLSSNFIGTFKNRDSLCFCALPENQRFSLIFENERNVVYLEQE